jgi:hypothetical protein
MEQTIPNPLFSMQPMSTTLIGRSADGALQSSGTERYLTARANVAIAKGQACAWNVAGVIGTPLSVGLMAVADEGFIFAGVAVNAAAAGGEVLLCTDGFCEVFFNAQTPAFGNKVLKPGANAGEPTASAAAGAATDIVGTYLGVVMAAKITGTNLALCFLRQV